MTGAPMTLEQADDWLCEIALFAKTQGDFFQRIAEGIPSGGIVRDLCRRS